MRKKIALLFVLAGCAKAAPKPAPAPLPPAKTFDETGERLIAGFLDRGFVISRQSGKPHHIGDSLIFSGLALGALDCVRGGAIEDALIAMIQEKDGAVYRHPELKGQGSMDGLLGLYFGIAKRLRACGTGAKWSEALKRHKAYLDRSGGRVNPDDEHFLAAGFDTVLDYVLFGAGLGAEPHPDRLRILEKLVTGWAVGVTYGRAACYRLNLSLLAYQTIERLEGRIGAGARNEFCQLTAKAEIPTIDHWCGREGLLSYLTAFQFDEWNYRHQRCGAWESQDGNGDEHPAVDRLIGLDQYYQF